MFEAIFLVDISKVVCIFLLCATCGKSGTNMKMTESQQLIIGMFRKLLLAKVILRFRIQNCIQAFFIRNTFLVNRKKYLMSSLSS